MIEDFIIGMAFNTLFTFIKAKDRRTKMKAAFRKLYLQILAAFPEFKNEE